MDPLIKAASHAHSVVSSYLPQEPFKPLKGFGQHLQAFHAYSADSRSVPAVHICSHVHPNLHQCLIFDGDGEGARVIGIEYIIPEHVFKTLPEGEHKYWHSHKVECEAGLLQLVALKSVPGGPITDAIEKPVMLHLHQTYGKTIHTWQYDKHPDLPLGPPQLMMSYTHESQVPKEMVDDRDANYGISTAAKKAARAEYLDLDFKADERADQSVQTGQGIKFEATPVDRGASTSSEGSGPESAAPEVVEAGGLKFVSPPA